MYIHFFDVPWSVIDLIVHKNINITVFICFSFFLSVILSLLAILVRHILGYVSVTSGSGLSFGDTNKRTPYECGFEPFEDARNIFDVKFYLVGLLFLIFDLEVAFMFPWAVCMSKTGFFSLWSMFYFLFILLVGFAFEWLRGALEWS